MTKFFTGEYTSNGGPYELAIEGGPASDAQLFEVLGAVWTNTSLEGCYLSRDKEPEEQIRIRPTPELLETTHLL